MSNLDSYGLKDGETVIVKGKVAWGDLGHKTAPKNSRFQQNKRWSISLMDPEVVRSDSDNGRKFVENELFSAGTGTNQGHTMIYASSTAPNAPLIFDGKSKARTGLPADEVLTDKRGQIRSIQSGTPVEIALTKFTSKTWNKQSMGLNSVLVEDINNIPFYSSGMTIENFGVKPETDRPPFNAAASDESTDTSTAEPSQSAPSKPANDDPFGGASVSSNDDPFA